jgi:hypothetical protein
MPTRKQRRRDAKSKRHEQAWYEIDEFGNEVELAPESVRSERAVEPSRNGSKASAAKPQQGRGRRQGREPQPPSWRRSIRRALILGAIVFIFFSFAGGKGNSRYAVAIQLTLMYTVLFIPFTYAIDRFAYRRWQARQAGGNPAPAARKKR